MAVKSDKLWGVEGNELWLEWLPLGQSHLCMEQVFPFFLQPFLGQPTQFRVEFTSRAQVPRMECVGLLIGTVAHGSNVNFSMTLQNSGVSTQWHNALDSWQLDHGGNQVEAGVSTHGRIRAPTPVKC